MAMKMISPKNVLVGVAGLYCLNQTNKWRKNRKGMKNAVGDLTVSGAQLRTVADVLKQEMDKGLTPEGSNLPMIPSWVAKSPTGKEDGHVMAIDMGGTSVRVQLVNIKGKEVKVEDTLVDVIPKRIREDGTAEQLFDFIASMVSDSLSKNGSSLEKEEKVPVGFTFSYPVEQSALDKGTLMTWTKEVKVEGVVGNDIVQLLNQALTRKKVGDRTEVKALCNDTVGTLVARQFEDSDCLGGLIVGTGANMCYWEDVSRITKLSKDKLPEGVDSMIVNMEWGNFNGGPDKVLPLTGADLAMDASSDKPGRQIFEKLISGQYLGEIARNTLVETATWHSKFGRKWRKKKNKIQEPGSLTSVMLSEICHDNSWRGKKIKKIMKKEFGIKTSKKERMAIKKLALAIAQRGGRMTAAGIQGVVEKSIAAKGESAKGLKHCTVAVDGSVYEKNETFRNACTDALKELQGNGPQIEMKITKDGSGAGAACIAALYS